MLTVNEVAGSMSHKNTIWITNHICWPCEIAPRKVMKIINNEADDDSIKIILNSEIDPNNWEELFYMKTK